MPDYDIAIKYKQPERTDEVLHISAQPHTLVDVIARCGCLDDHFKEITELTVYNKSNPAGQKDEKPTMPSAQPAEP
jgi:hypothetical protein